MTNRKYAMLIRRRLLRNVSEHHKRGLETSEKRAMFLNRETQYYQVGAKITVIFAIKKNHSKNCNGFCTNLTQRCPSLKIKYNHN